MSNLRRRSLASVSPWREKGAAKRKLKQLSVKS